MTSLERWQAEYEYAWRGYQESGRMVDVIIPDCPDDVFESASLDAEDWAPAERAEADMRDLLSEIVGVSNG